MDQRHRDLHIDMLSSFRTFFAILKSIGNAALSLDFTTGILDPKITFARDTTGTYVGSNGLIQTAAINIPRFDYDPATLAMRGLLVEDARTNVLLYSQSFGTAPWVLNAATVSASGTAPDGTTATLLTDTTAGGYVYQGFTTSASIYSTSVYAKAGTSTTISVSLATSGYGAGINCTFDLTNGAVGTILTYGGAGNQNAYIENAGNGWYKCTVVTSCAASTTYYSTCLIPGASSTVYIWGMQAELGDTSSSYIPTTTVAVTRGIDIAEVNSISSFYNSEASTLFFQGIPTATLLSPLQNCVALHDKSYTGPLSNGAFQNRMNLARYYFGAGIGVVTAQGTNTLLDIEPIWPAFTLGKIAMSNTRNKQLSCCNGTTSGSNTSVSIPNPATTLTIGSRPVDNLFAWRGRIQKVEYYNTAMNEAQLKAITGGWVETDPYWNNVSLLLQADGPANTRNNNVFLDGSVNAVAITRNGKVTQGSVSPFTKTYPYDVNLGSGSMYFSGGTSDYLTLPASSTWALGTTGTIEAWLYCTLGGQVNQRFVSITNSGSAIDLFLDSSNRVSFVDTTGNAVVYCTSAISLNTWVHVAFVLNAGAVSVYYNGVLQTLAGGTTTGYNYNNANALWISGIPGYSGYTWNGYISNLRIVKGVAVYTGAFTPPTAPLAKTQVANAISNIGAITETVPTNVIASIVDYLVVAGGGGGGGSLAGGGGGGGLLAGSNLVVGTGTPITVTVGAGGLKGTGQGSHGSNGGSSTFATITTVGGGGGGAYNGYTLTGNDGNVGGSGGGAGSSEVAQTHNGGAGTDGQGYAGGSTLGRNTYNSGGGGGAGGAGSPGVAAGGGFGGVGLTSSITGTSTYYAGGGGGAGYGAIAGQVAGVGGLGGGASGESVTNTVAPNGIANTGGGGGGGCYVYAGTGSGGTGGDGVVIIRHLSTEPVAITTGSPVVTTSNGYRIYKFNTSGTIQFSISPTPTAIPFSLESLVVAGGGGGGGSHGAGGGGGAGGLVYHPNKTVAFGAGIPIIIGAGGQGGRYYAASTTGSYGTTNNSHGFAGGNSVFGDIIAQGGGGGNEAFYTDSVYKNGGSGGGAGDYYFGVANPGASRGGLATQTNSGGGTGYGFPGGSRGPGGPTTAEDSSHAVPHEGSGGGGAGGTATGGGSSTASNGGIGRYYQQFTNAGFPAGWFAGGGGGGYYTNGPITPTNIPGSNTGAKGGGGRGRDGASTNATVGVANTGGGGGGGSGNNTAPNAPDGGSGIVILRHLDLFPIATTTGSPTIVTSGGYTTYTFTSSGTIKWGTSPTGLLLNGANAAIVDTTGNNILETVGDSQISTAVRQYGTGSLKFDGTGDYLSTPATPALAFGSGDFTIEGWVYANALNSYNGVFAQWPASDGSASNSYVLESVGSSMNFYWVSGVTLYGPATLGTITTGSWIHYAICRSGNTLYPFKNGVLGTTVSITQTLNSPTSAITVGGAVAAGGHWNGYIDDLRITKGVARYTAAFTPPVTALPFVPQLVAPVAASAMPLAIETLVVAGGAGGGGWGGGGGAGGLIHNPLYTVTSGSSYVITVGAGGIAGTTSYSSGGDGSYSRFGTMTSVGGGGAGHYQGFAGRFGGSGGGGGGHSIVSTQVGGYGIIGQGNAGGTSGGYDNSNYYGSGGGGGASAVGTNHSGYTGGGGGIGTAYSISGIPTYYGGGGGGHTPTAGYGIAAGGGGGGGAGGCYYSNISAVSGTANTGGGGGGGYYGIGAGGSGVVIIRYLDTYLPASATTGSPTYTVVNGYRVYKFTASGSITF
jgi:hypothetical protein